MRNRIYNNHTIEASKTSAIFETIHEKPTNCWIFQHPTPKESQVEEYDTLSSDSLDFELYFREIDQSVETLLKKALIGVGEKRAENIQEIRQKTINSSR